MTIEKHMLLPLIILAVTILASGIVISRQAAEIDDLQANKLNIAALKDEHKDFQQTAEQIIRDCIVHTSP